MRWQVRRNLDWHLNYSEGYRAPDFKELYFDFQNPSVGYRVTGNENLEAERSLYINTQLNWQADDSLRLKMNIFQNQVRNLIAVQSLEVATDERTAIYTYANIAAARLRGFEGSMEKRWSAWLQNNLSYEYPKERVYVVRSERGEFFAISIANYYDAAGTPAIISIGWKSLLPPEELK